MPREMSKTPATSAMVGWIDFPCLVGLSYRAKVSWMVDGIAHSARFHVRRDLAKVYEADFLLAQESRTRYIEELEQKRRRPRWWPLSNAPRYIPAERAELLRSKAVAKGHHFHAEPPRSVLEFRTRATESGSPPPGLFPEKIYEWMNEFLSNYRASILPAMRYSVPVVSAANTRTTLYRVGRAYTLYNFSPWDHHVLMWNQFSSTFPFEQRFREFLRVPLSPEEQAFLSLFPLLQQGRFGEAVVAANAIHDQILKQLVLAIAPTQKLGDLLWKQYRSRTDDAYNDLLPSLGVPRLADAEQGLWARLKRARTVRHGAAHGVFDPSISEREVRPHLQAIYDSIEWLIASSSGKIAKWRLSVANLKGDDEPKQFA